MQVFQIHIDIRNLKKKKKLQFAARFRWVCRFLLFFCYFSAIFLFPGSFLPECCIFCGIPATQQGETRLSFLWMAQEKYKNTTWTFLVRFVKKVKFELVCSLWGGIGRLRGRRGCRWTPWNRFYWPTAIYTLRASCNFAAGAKRR